MKYQLNFTHTKFFLILLLFHFPIHKAFLKISKPTKMHLLHSYLQLLNKDQSRHEPHKLLYLQKALHFLIRPKFNFIYLSCICKISNITKSKYSNFLFSFSKLCHCVIKHIIGDNTCSSFTIAYSKKSTDFNKCIFYIDEFTILSCYGNFLIFCLKFL